MVTNLGFGIPAKAPVLHMRCRLATQTFTEGANCKEGFDHQSFLRSQFLLPSLIKQGQPSIKSHHQVKPMWEENRHSSHKLLSCYPPAQPLIKFWALDVPTLLTLPISQALAVCPCILLQQQVHQPLLISLKAIPLPSSHV